MDRSAGTPAPVFCAGAAGNRPCVAPCHPWWGRPRRCGLAPTWHWMLYLYTPRPGPHPWASSGTAPARALRVRHMGNNELLLRTYATISSHDRELWTDPSLIGCTDRGRAGYPSDSSRAGREDSDDTSSRTLRLRHRVTSATVPGHSARRGARAIWPLIRYTLMGATPASHTSRRRAQTEPSARAGMSRSPPHFERLADTCRCSSRFWRLADMSRCLPLTS